MEAYGKQISLNYKKYYAKKLHPNIIGIMGKVLYENRGSQEDYTRTRLSTNSSNLSIASLIIDKHSSKDCS